MSNLGMALGWKYPGVEGIFTKENTDDGSLEISSWPGELGAPPTEQQQNAIIAEYTAHLDAMRYRERRAAAYIEEMGVDSNPINTIGDVLDALLGQIEAASAAGHITATAEVSSLLAVRASIKSRFPKPQP